jgi:signal transduction histidine kinase
MIEPPQDAGSVTTASGPLPTEHVLLLNREMRLRWQMLRIFSPVLLILLFLALALVIRAQRPVGLVHLALGVCAWGVTVWSLRARHPLIAAYALVAGYILVTTLLVGVFGPLIGYITFATVTASFFLILPIVIAGLIADVATVLITAAICLAYISILFIVVPSNSDLNEVISHRGGIVLFIIPFAIQLLTTALMIERTWVLGQLRRRLSSVEAAYAREKELKRLREQFIANVNHELRTPIMAAQGYIALASELNEQEDATGRRQMLQEAGKVIDELIQLVKSVLNVRRIKADAQPLTETFTLHPVVMRAMTLLNLCDVGKDQREVRLDMSEDLAVQADHERVYEVVVNLLSNALKYSPGGEPIEISAHEVVPTSAARRGTRPLPSMVEVTVRDYGLGVPPEQIALLFEPFVRLERDIASPVAGTGLGLAICHTHIAAMHGRIWCESSGIQGEGTAFHFTLPLAPVMGEQSAVPVAAKTSGNGG